MLNLPPEFIEAEIGTMNDSVRLSTSMRDLRNDKVKLPLTLMRDGSRLQIDVTF